MKSILKNIHILLLAGLFLPITELIAQNNAITSLRNCGTMDYLHEQIKNDPGVEIRMQNSRDWISRYVSQHEASLVNGKTVYTIPVVVHVVYRNSTENISDAQVQSQINILNQDYRKQNSDANLVPGVWSSIAADCEINFCLAVRDPFNVPTNGITRTASTQTSFDLSNNNVKFNSTGGHDIWNPDQYLNLWVCNLDGTLLGYAQFPNSGSPTTDGVVIDYQDFGNIGTATPPFDKGRTATHEIGHWLGLYHIWGDEPACNGDDNVNDTPQQLDRNYGCPVFPNSSGSGSACSGSNGSMFMNYMDYTNDACMYMFTNGQKAVMVATLTQIRSALLSSNACVPQTGPVCDSLSNFKSTNSLVILTPGDVGSSGTGYISGTNSYNDKAKADKYIYPASSYDVTGVWIYFGYIFAGSGSNTYEVKVWDDDGSNSSPGTVLATANVTAQTIFNNLMNSSPTLVTFSNTPNLTGSFYAGVEFDPSTGDTLVIITNDIGQSPTNTAWEKWSDNTWHPFNDPSSWAVSLSHYIAPVICVNTNTKNVQDFNEKFQLNLYPNPVSEKLFLMIQQSNFSNNVQFRINGLAGNLIKEFNITCTNGETVSLDVNELPEGIYFLEAVSKEQRNIQKFVVQR